MLDISMIHSLMSVGVEVAFNLPFDGSDHFEKTTRALLKIAHKGLINI